MLYKTDYRQYVEKYAEKYGVEKELLYAVIKVESKFDPNAISKSKAKGLMQIMDSTAKEIAKKVIKMVGLDETYLQKSPFDLSGGQKRRIAIAGILAMDPDILVLDEPTAGLDPQGIREMMDLFKSIHQLGKTVILVTHDMNHVLEYCNEVIVMNEGCVERKGKVKDVFKDSDYLLNLGIDLPLITNMIIDLNKKGFQLDTSINNIDDLVEALGGELYG